MRKFAFIVIGLLLLLILAAIVIPFIIPSSVYKSAIQDQLSERLARKVEIGGDVSISPLPSLKVKVGEVTIDNPDGFTSDHFAKMDGLDVRVKLLPLLSRRVEISAFELRSPDIKLEKRADGQTNWVLGQNDDANGTAPAGPFKRDGRYAELDAAIGKFIIEDGSIDYSDLVSGRAHNITDVDLQLNMPSLAEELTANGNIVLDGLPADIDLTLSTPRSFLNGQQTPVDLTLGTGFGDISAKGYFTESEDLHFSLDVIGMIRDFGPLSPFLPSETNIPELADVVDFSGNYSYDGEKIDAKNADIKIDGPVINTRFKGDAVFKDRFGGTGDIEVDVKDFQKLTQLLKLDTPVNDAVKTASISSKINLQGDTVIADKLNARLNGDGLSTEFNGQGKFGDQTELNGTFSSNITSIPEFANKLKLAQPQLAALGDGAAAGTIKYNGQETLITLERAQTTGPNLSASYTGDIKLDDKSIEFAGNFTSAVPELSRLAEVTGQEIPYANSVRRVETKGKVSGTSDNLLFDAMQINLSEGELNGVFDGQATVNNGFTLDGNLKADIPSARQLTKTTTGVELPPSTKAGQIYERISVEGQVSGNPAELRFSNAGLAMDAIKGDGNFQLDLTTEKPTLKGTMDMGQIDLRPYMAAYSAGADGIQPWSEVPYNFSALRLMDGNYVLKTPEVIFGPLTFGQTELDTIVTNGVLTAKLPEVNLYGGLGVLTATLDASGDIPKVKLAVTLEDIRSNRFLGSLANFTQLEGNGHTLLEITGEGRSQAEIMRSLNGYGDFEVIGGVIKGIDLSKFLTGVDESLTQKVLPQGIGQKYATNFNDMVGKFKIQNGVISIESFNLEAVGVHASGSGALDIGNQTLDFGLRPRLTTANANDIGRFGIPIRFKGDWGNIKPGPDTELLQKIAIEKAKIKAREEITNRVGGQVGNVIGGILGVPTETPTPEQPTEPATEPAVPENTEAQPTAPQEIVNTETPQEPDPTTPPAEEKEKPLEKQILDNALEGLFGGKKDTPDE